MSASFGTMNAASMQLHANRACHCVLRNKNGTPVHKQARVTRTHALSPTAKADTEARLFHDVEKSYAASSFPIPPEKLIQMTKDYLVGSSASGADYYNEILDENFQFVGPVVGPLLKEPFIKAIMSLDPGGAFPDLQSNIFAFNVDPFDMNRVWFMSRNKGTNTGSLAGNEATGMKYEGPPEVLSVSWTPEGKVSKLTVGAVADRTVGNSGGLGGVFGMLYAIGKPFPFPEAMPFKPTIQYKFFSAIGNIASAFKKK